MSRFDTLFQSLKAKNEGAFVPFVIQILTVHLKLLKL